MMMVRALHTLLLISASVAAASSSSSSSSRGLRGTHESERVVHLKHLIKDLDSSSAKISSSREKRHHSVSVLKELQRTAEGIPAASLEENDNTENKDEIEKLNKITNTADENVEQESAIMRTSSKIEDEVDSLKAKLTKEDMFFASDALNNITSWEDAIYSTNEGLLKDSTAIGSDSRAVRKSINEGGDRDEELTQLQTIIDTANGDLNEGADVEKHSNSVMESAKKMAKKLPHHADEFKEISDTSQTIIEANAMLMEDSATIANDAQAVYSSLTGGAGAAAAEESNAQMDAPALREQHGTAAPAPQVPMKAKAKAKATATKLEAATTPVAQGLIQPLSLRPAVGGA